MFTNRYEIAAEVLVPVKIIIAANSKEEAERRLHEGAWHGVCDADWDHSVVRTQTAPPKDITIHGSDPRD